MTGTVLVMPNTLSIVLDGNRPYNIGKDHPYYDEIRQASKDEDWATINDLIDVKEKIIDYVTPVLKEADIEVYQNRVLFNGEQLNGALANQIVEMARGGYEVTPLVNFLRNLKQNPSFAAVNELYEWMECGGLTSITQDGCFLAYKKVRDDYKDIYSRTFDNSIGQVCEMPRNKVNDDRNQTCSAGLHFCAYSYLNHYMGSGSDVRVMIVKINPADVVSIPVDYGHAKGRTWRYEVVGEDLAWQDRQVLQTPVDTEFDVDDEDTLFVNDADDSGNVEGADFYPTASHWDRQVSDQELLEEKINESGITITEMASIYNNVTGNNITKFRDRSTGIARLKPYASEILAEDLI